MDVRELLLLGFVNRRETHGYELVKFLDQRMNFLIDLKPPTTYSLLDRLEQHGYVTSRLEREGNWPERRVYRITSEGEVRFRDLLRENLAAFLPARFPDEVGLYFMDQLPDSEVRVALEAKLAQVVCRLAELREQVEQHAETPAHWLFEHHLAHLECERAWLEETLQHRGNLSNALAATREQTVNGRKLTRRLTERET